MIYFATLEFLPTRFSTSLLKTLHDYANILDEHCQLGRREEIDSSHYVEDTYFAWKIQDCSINLFLSDESETSEWLCVTITSKHADARNLINNIQEGLKPFVSESKTFFRPVI